MREELLGILSPFPGWEPEAGEEGSLMPLGLCPV